MKTQEIDGVRCVSTAELNAALPFVMKAEDMVSWGFEPFKRIRAGFWWRLSDVEGILDRVDQLVDAARAKVQEMQ